MQLVDARRLTGPNLLARSPLVIVELAFADDKGYVKLPNVNGLIEMTDMREAQRSYEANLRAIEVARTMLQRTIDLLR